jgi:pimeloyl-ACP methyl ester carboxylesterase
MKKTVSKDGTTIAFDQTGEGPPVILVVGAFNDRTTGAPLAATLGRQFTVVSYDRRGRGDSGDTAPYAIEREVEDLAAVIGAVGGAASVLGFSSGALLAMRAAAAGLPITRLALYDTPLGGPTSGKSHTAALAALIAEGRRGDAVEYFQEKVVGISSQVVAQLRQAPFRPALERIAPTLVYDSMLLGDGALSTELAAAVPVPTLALAGGAGAPFMRETAQALARALPHGQSQVVEGQGHDLTPALGPVLERFFASH